MRTIEVDILVVGGGSAGLMAALEAKKDNLNVAVICKSKAGRSGNTLVSGASLSVLNEKGEYNDSLETFKNDILNSGAGINDPMLVDLFVEQSNSVLDTLHEYGVVFESVDGEQLVKQAPGHSVRRYYPIDPNGFSYMNRGLGLMLPLLAQAERSGVHIINNSTVIKLVTSENSIYGAVAIDNKTSEIIFLRTGIIILAAGGGCTLFSRNNNTADVTCDSYRLAYEAGAALRDMELVQFYPTMMYEPISMTITNPLFGDGAVLKNINGEEFLYRYSEKGNKVTRDIMARAIKIEIDAGRGNPKYVFVDCSKIDGDILDKRYKDISDALKRVQLDIKKDLLPIAPSAHFYMGGICIDSECKTAVNGLLACGEAVGGLHGANRLAGGALAETIVFGKIAGQTARRLYKKVDCHTVLSENIDIVSKNRGTIDINDLISAIRNTMWTNSSVVRSKESLNIAEKDIENIAKEMESVEISDSKDIYKYYRLASLLITVRMLIKGSLLRQESRGAFHRIDYPNTESQFTGNFYFRNNAANELEVTFKKLKERYNGGYQY